MAKQRDFEYRHSGFDTEKEAQECLDDIQAWLRRTYGEADWAVVASVSRGPYGYIVDLSAKYRPDFYA
jgi:hypothetical protein